MAKVTVLVCDVCGSQEGVKHYEFREGSRRANVDLCATDGEPVEQLFKRAAAAPQKPRVTRTRTPKVTSLEEIEALKKKA